MTRKLFTIIAITFFVAAVPGFVLADSSGMGSSQAGSDMNYSSDIGTPSRTGQSESALIGSESAMGDFGPENYLAAEISSDPSLRAAQSSHTVEAYNWPESGVVATGAFSDSGDAIGTGAVAGSGISDSGVSRSAERGFVKGEQFDRSVAVHNVAPVAPRANADTWMEFHDPNYPNAESSLTADRWPGSGAVGTGALPGSGDRDYSDSISAQRTWSDDVYPYSEPVGTGVVPDTIETGSVPLHETSTHFNPFFPERRMIDQGGGGE